MKLKDLLRDVAVVQLQADPELEIETVAYDSRKVTPGAAFVAVTGFAADGNRYIPMALEKGAAVVITAKEPKDPIPYVLVENDRLALALMGRNFYGNPAASMTMIGVTGTNGKTSVTLLTKHVLEQVTGAKVGLIGTMENLVGDEVLPTDRTTPESFELQGLFARMRDAGCRYVVMEVSSHAVVLERIGGVAYDVAAFTNLTEDHLDFHKTMENYCAAKAELFARSSRAVLNCDDEWYADIARKVCGPALTTSVKQPAGLYAENICPAADGVAFDAVMGDVRVRVQLPIPGEFTVYNALTVLGIAANLGISLPDAAEALRSAQGVRGRVEVVPTPGKPYTVLIDYAHTPDGLKNVLSSVRKFCKGRLIAVFGCGGDRDPIKRPIMGEIGADLADIAIITSDNPRTERPMAIIEDILKGIDMEKSGCVVIENRVQAIHHAMDIAEKNDIIVLAGKGHETYQEICGVKYPLDERQVVAEYLSK